MLYSSFLLLASLAVATTTSGQHVAAVVSPQAAASGPREKTVTISVTNASLRDVITEITQQSGLRVSYPEGLVSAQPKVSLQINAVTPESALNTAIART